MVDEDLEIVKVALAVITPGPGEDLLEARVLAFGLPHDESGACTVQAIWDRRYACCYWQERYGCSMKDDQ